MARIRSIKPELRTSITVSAWPREVRYFFVLLWGYLDDYGRGVDDERLIKSDCFPRDEDLTPLDIDTWLEIIADAGPVCRYEVDGRRYLHCTNWSEHQRPSHPTRSKIPPCPECHPDGPHGFRVWRDANPEGPKARSRKAREAIANSSGGSSGGTGATAEDLSNGAPPEGFARDSGEVRELSNPRGQADEPAGHSDSGKAPEVLPNSSGDFRGSSPLSKGAREQGSKGERNARAGARDSKPLSQQSDWQPSQTARDVADADIRRLGPAGEREATRKFLNNRRASDRMPTDADWVTWLANERPGPEEIAPEETWTPPRFRNWSDYEDAPPAPDPDDRPHLSVVPDPEPPLPAAEARAQAKAAAHAAKHGTADTA